MEYISAFRFSIYDEQYVKWHVPSLMETLLLIIFNDNIVQMFACNLSNGDPLGLDWKI